MSFNQFTVLEEFENFIRNNEFPSDQILDRMMALTLPDEGSQEPMLNLLQNGTGKKRSAENDVDTPVAKKTRHECSTCGKAFTRTDNFKTASTHSYKQETTSVFEM
ncbi:hypothetical protein OS493_032775 [Desmophyllum pertusum]|uniref:C2H2-type domain-containing protein n=1 Tax=Desmophyllum pertusum TaxID=174260 RepID=A0A9X0D2U9_9CNID|nr:hypothetical protein OS493_032775 [Desmophyllum pertusum]